MFCEKCGKRIEDDSSFCIYCGNRIADSENMNQTDVSSGSEQEEGKAQTNAAQSDGQFAPVNFKQAAEAVIDTHYPKMKFLDQFKEMCRHLTLVGWLGLLMFVLFGALGWLTVILSLIRQSLEAIPGIFLFWCIAGYCYVFLLYQFWQVAQVSGQLFVQLPQGKTGEEWADEIQRHFSYPKAESIHLADGKMMLKSPMGMTELVIEGDRLYLKVKRRKNMQSSGYWELKHAFEADEIKNAMQCFVNRQALPSNFQQIQKIRAKSRIGTLKVVLTVFGIILAILLPFILPLAEKIGKNFDFSSGDYTSFASQGSESSLQSDSMDFSVSETESENTAYTQPLQESSSATEESDDTQANSSQGETVQAGDTFDLQAYDANGFTEGWEYFQNPILNGSGGMETAVFAGDQANSLGSVLQGVFDRVTWEDITEEGMQGSEFRFTAEQGKNRLIMEIGYLGMGIGGGGYFSAGSIMLEDGTLTLLDDRQCAVLVASLYDFYCETYAKAKETTVYQLVGTWVNEDESTTLEIDLNNYGGSAYKVISADENSLYLEITRKDGNVELRQVEWVDENTFHLFYAEWDNTDFIDAFYRAS